MKSRLILIVLFAFSLFSCSNKEKNERFREFFKNETDYNLMCLLSQKKYKKANLYIDNHPEIISNSFSDVPYYSVLLEAVHENNEAAVKLLLEKGFNPNVKSSFSSPLACDCDYSTSKKSIKDYENPSIMKLLLDYGADANSGEYGSYCADLDDKHNGQPERTPLMLLCHYPDFIDVQEKIDLLINKGNVDVNYQTCTGYTAVAASLEYSNAIRIAYYLICKLHANVNTVFYDNVYYYERKENPQTPVMLLRKFAFPLDSEEYQLKLQIIKEFESQGVDYNSEPIPDNMFKAIKEAYPDSWKEYIKVY